jgi:Tfp pilus assembly protein PilO
MEKKKQTLNWRYLINTRRFILIAGALVVGALLIGALAIYPQITASADAYQDLVKSKQRIAKLRKKILQLDTYQDSAVLAQIDQIDLVMPLDKPLLELLSGLYYLSQETGVSFTDLSLSPGKITGEENLRGSFGKIEVDLVIAGTFNQVNTFLKEVERLAPLTTVVDMSLDEKGSPKIEDDTNFEAELTVETYYFNKEIIAKIDTPVPEFKENHDQILNDIKEYTYVGPNLSQNLIKDFLAESEVDDLFGVGNPVTTGNL